MNEQVFALDIGTQSVTGVILLKKGKSFEIIDLYTKHHDERAMLDGQIQNVIEVANIIKDVKEHLEEKHGPLSEVCVAAAGRALKTVRAEASVSLNGQPITKEEEIKHLELSAVQQAQIKLAEESDVKDYHCVGYSVTHYRLDGDIIGSFIDQIGDEASVEVIATFLPKIVVESLIAALERADLKMKALTLEPIAAIHVLMPESMRRLNVGLIDIGAGTSDIAISDEGTIVAYGMVPVAGDEITEKVSDHYLLDFKLAEKLKRKVVVEKEATVEDILGFEVTVTYDELLSVIDDSVDHLAKLLADKVKSLNNKAPQAVMLIGGGSLTPMIEEKLANYLQLPANRVAVRGSEAIQVVANKEAIPRGPEFVTPIGIAISATENPFHYVNVFVNDKPTYLFTMDEQTIGDCLIQAGIDLNDYYGKIGLAYFVKVNGEQITIPGVRGEAPKITLNGQPASVDDNVKENDRIHIEKGKDGTSPHITISDLVGEIEPVECYINDEKIAIEPRYLVNGKPVQPDYRINDNDDIVVSIPETYGQVLNELDIDERHLYHFVIYVNGRPLEFENARSKLIVNGKPASLSQPIRKGDKVEIVPSEPITVKKVLQKLEKPRQYSIDVTFNNLPVTLTQPLVTVKRNDKELHDDDVVQANDRLTIEENKQKDFIYQDIFRYVNLDVSQRSGNYEVLLNGQPANFHHVIRDGDALSIEFK